MTVGEKRKRRDHRNMLAALVLAGGGLANCSDVAQVLDRPRSEVTFVCQGGKSLTATFFPATDRYVDLKLSDGRTLSVPHALSASGARYANSDESFVFWNKGMTAFITEGASNQETYSNCVASR